jgi:hypothetical protein
MTTTLPAVDDIRRVVCDELSTRGGSVTDAAGDERRLFLRGLVPMKRDVRPGDALLAGVAVMVADRRVSVHPYTFRQVCSNGAILARVIQTRCVERLPDGAADYEIQTVLDELREVVAECSRPETFAEVVRQVRSATTERAELLISLLPSLLQSALPANHVYHLLAEIVGEFGADGDRSVFGLLNSVTAVARDQSDPDLRWRLEELGGRIPALARPIRKQHLEPAARERTEILA